MKKIIAIIALVCCNTFIYAQSAKAVGYIDAMQKKYKAMSSFAASFSYATEGAAPMNGSISVKGTKFRLKTAGQEIFNNGKEVATYIKEINEVNVSAFDPAENDLNPAKIYSFDKKAYKINLAGEEGSTATVELVPNSKNSQMQKISIKINKADHAVKEWTIINKAGKKQNFKVLKIESKSLDDKFFTFDKKQYPGVEVNDLR
ncbi:LolA family protein [Aquirufa rosea]|uniref:Outer membrane lipoprotein carrier protein LolA n=1 Tax=Aquirufa rosea TaxID=2509241 RepID=A0A4Q1BXG4_9BACT|nr:outer membrane lipoprotein carrier protein LolA [Aquirufa rosea]RXK47090.1 outer membrane lipoprotein carrier protein LolA [Aquirufa rosea]